MPSEVHTYEVNLECRPTNFQTAMDTLTIGDLHGNVLKFFHILLTYQVIRFKDEAKADEHYQALKLICENTAKISQERTAIEGELDETYNELIDKLKEELSTQNKKDELQKYQDYKQTKLDTIEPFELLLLEYLDDFKLLLDVFEVHPQNVCKKIRLIGDELADRVYSDAYTLLFFHSLRSKGLEISSLFSNHGKEFLIAFEKLFRNSEFLPAFEVGTSALGSIFMLEALFRHANRLYDEESVSVPTINSSEIVDDVFLSPDPEKNTQQEAQLDLQSPPIDKHPIEELEQSDEDSVQGSEASEADEKSEQASQASEGEEESLVSSLESESEEPSESFYSGKMIDQFMPIMECHYQSVKLLDYMVVDQKNITLFTHAPVGFGVIRSLATYFHIEYKDENIEGLTETIDKINAEFNTRYIAKKEIHKINLGVSNVREMTVGQIFAFPLTHIIWNSWNPYKDYMSPRPKEYKGYNISYVHGHMTPEDTYSHVHVLNSMNGHCSLGYKEKLLHDYPHLGEKFKFETVMVSNEIKPKLVYSPSHAFHKPSVKEDGKSTEASLKSSSPKI